MFGLFPSCITVSLRIGRSAFWPPDDRVSSIGLGRQIHLVYRIADDLPLFSSNPKFKIVAQELHTIGARTLGCLEATVTWGPL